MTDYIFQGSLSDNPLPVVLQKIHYYKVPGVLVAENPPAKKGIYISGGEVIFATSNQEDDRLGEYLLSRGVITKAQYDRSVILLKQTGKRQGNIFIDIGAISPSELFSYVKDQVISIVWSLFNWQVGMVTFRVGKFKEDEVIKLHIDTRKIIIDGIKKINNVKWIIQILGGRDGVYLPNDDALSLLDQLPIGTEEKKIFRFVDGIRNIEEIVKVSHVDQSLACKIIYALNVLGIIKKKDSQIKMKLDNGIEKESK